MEERLPKVGIILVNFNNYDDTYGCLKTLELCTYKQILVVVVDNDSADHSAERLEKEFPWATVLRSGKNIGFTGGNNLGIEHAMESGCEHVLLLNNDTFVTPDFLQPLVERLESAPDIAGVSGKIYYAPQAIGGKERIIWYAGSYRAWYMGHKHFGVLQEDTGAYDTAKDVVYGNGCLLLMRGEVVRRIGGLSDDYFVYWEEADWCRRAQLIGYRAVYEPRSVIYHNFRSAPVGHETAFHMYLQYRNAFIFAGKYYHGLDLLQFYLFYPIYIGYRILLDIPTKNWKAIRATVLGVIDYFRGFRGARGLRERGFLKW